MTNDDKDLKPCPFCGDTKYLRVTYQDSKANASITGDKKYWGVFCMEKCGASIDSIYPTREEAIRVWNTRATPQKPSEPLKELDEVRAKLKEFYADYESCVTPEERRGCLDHWESEFGQPSEKKVLSVEDMKKIMWDLENKLGYQPAYETIAQAIESALPAQREVSESCGCCGSKMVYIRGKFPKEDNRLICPCCAYERLEQINDISNKDYGKSYQTGEMKKLNGG